MNEWQPIETAPKDGTWFMICNEHDGFDSYEVGKYEPYMVDEYVPIGEGLFRQEKRQLIDWRGFSNMRRATHWIPVPALPLNAKQRPVGGECG